MANVLIIDDEEVFAKNAARFIEKAGHSALTAHTGKLGLESMTRNPPDVIVLDYRLPDMDGISIIERIRALDTGVPILMITGHGSIELAVNAMKAGANDLLTKPVSLADLCQRVNQFVDKQRDSGRLRYFEQRESQTAHPIIGDSQVMLDMRARLARMAEASSLDHLPPILILGETGTGKELVARALHFRKRAGESRRSSNLIALQSPTTCSNPNSSAMSAVPLPTPKSARLVCSKRQTKAPCFWTKSGR
jgi:two-component system response regulator AtoC